MTFIKHKFGQTFYLKHKSKSKTKKTPIVFLHGGPGGTHDYFLNLKSLSKDRDLYMYDQIGGGGSSTIEPKLWKIETFVEELSILLDKWKLDSFILLGTSWGTTLALEYLLKTKDKRIEKIIFQSPLFSEKDWSVDAKRLINGMPANSKKVIKYCHEIGATDSKVYKEAVTTYYLKHVLRNKKILLRKRKPNVGGELIYMHMWGASEFYATGTLKNYERVSHLSKIKVPVLLVCGEHDEATPKTVKKYHRLIKDSTFRIVKNASHCIAIENTKGLLQEINKFLE